MSESDPYTYPGTNVLINRYDIRDARLLETVERRHVGNRIEEGTPHGNFDLKHLQDIHYHLFQDVYPWAGEIRTVQIAKANWFLPAERIEMGMADVHQRLANSNFLKGTTSADFAEKSSEIIADINHVHPFHEGNGRTQLQYFEQLAAQAGHPIELNRLNRDQWIEGSIQSHAHEPAIMREAISGMLETPDHTLTATQQEQDEELTQHI